MKIAIYARKSRLSDKGESINNQIDTCKNYIHQWGNVGEDIEFIIYKDEGFSGGNTDRPQFQQMLNDAKASKFQKLICYRLDRVSRSIADFSNTYELLNEHGIEFVSVKEQFDTSTPIGRAMLNISMVFAQLERETIAERIKDNMLALSKTGRWLGGKTPTGFISKPVEYMGDVNEKKMYQLEVIPEEIETIKLIYAKFLDIKSLRGVESYLLIHDIYTPNGKRYTASTLKDILINPVYAAADNDSYLYFNSIDCNICMRPEDFNGLNGIMSYNRTDQTGKKATLKTPDNWIIAVGKHDAIIPGADWVYTQQLLKSNTANQFYNKESMSYGLLSGLIKCKCCGSTMRIKKGKINASGEQCFVYVCNTKELSRRTKCNVQNIIGQEVDKDILAYVISVAHDESIINQMLDSSKADITQNVKDTSSQKQQIENDIVDIEDKIKNLMEQMENIDSSSTLFPIYLEKLKSLAEKKELLEVTLNKHEDTLAQATAANINLKIVKQALNDLLTLSQNTDVQLQRSILRSVIEKIIWDGENLEIEMFGKRTIQTLSTCKDAATDTTLCCDSECYSHC